MARSPIALLERSRCTEISDRPVRLRRPDRRRRLLPIYVRQRGNQASDAAAAADLARLARGLRVVAVVLEGHLRRATSLERRRSLARRDAVGIALSDIGVILRGEPV